MADEHSMQESRETQHPGQAQPTRATGPTSWPRPTVAPSTSMKSAALPLELQLHLLRELQFRDYEASAGHAPAAGDARFIMSTSENLPALIEQGRFRQELYHRISVISLMLPPLRHRGTDVELLAESFRDHYAREFHKIGRRLHPRCARRPAEARLAGQRPRARGRHPASRRPVQRPADHVQPSGADPEPPPPDARTSAAPRPGRTSRWASGR